MTVDTEARAERAHLVAELREDARLMYEMLRSGYRRPEFRALVLGWADRMSRAADMLDDEDR